MSGDKKPYTRYSYSKFSDQNLEKSDEGLEKSDYLNNATTDLVDKKALKIEKPKKKNDLGLEKSDYLNKKASKIAKGS